MAAPRALLASKTPPGPHRDIHNKYSLDEIIVHNKANPDNADSIFDSSSVLEVRNALCSFLNLLMKILNLYAISKVQAEDRIKNLTPDEKKLIPLLMLGS